MKTATARQQAPQKAQPTLIFADAPGLDFARLNWNLT
jgi:hypothetical protein